MNRFMVVKGGALGHLGSGDVKVKVVNRFHDATSGMCHHICVDGGGWGFGGLGEVGRGGLGFRWWCAVLINGHN